MEQLIRLAGLISATPRRTGAIGHRFEALIEIKESKKTYRGMEQLIRLAGLISAAADTGSKH